MAEFDMTIQPVKHSHVFLGEGHERAKRRTWAVIWLCGAMMTLEIVGGLILGSIALVADGLHMSTHAGALLLAALAYGCAHSHAHGPRFTFGTGKLGDLAGFTSAIVLAMIAVLIGYEAISRLFEPVPIHFAEAIPIACLGLLVNIGSAWLLSSGGGHQHHGHDHGHGYDQDDADLDGHDDEYRLETDIGPIVLSVVVDRVPAPFRIRSETGASLQASAWSIETERVGGARQLFTMLDRGSCLESVNDIPEPHEFTAHVRVGREADARTYSVGFEEHVHA